MFASCCEWLTNLLQRAGEQGTAVVAARREDGVRQFYIQARSLTQWQAQTWQRLLHTEPWQAQMAPLFRDENGRLAAVVISMRVPIFFCPHCGVDLAKLIKRQAKQFDELAASHGSLAND